MSASWELRWPSGASLGASPALTGRYPGAPREIAGSSPDRRFQPVALLGASRGSLGASVGAPREPPRVSHAVDVLKMFAILKKLSFFSKSEKSICLQFWKTLKSIAYAIVSTKLGSSGVAATKSEKCQKPMFLPWIVQWPKDKMWS